MPGLVGVAVKVTGVPAQILFNDAAIDTLTESPALTATGKSTGTPEHSPTFGVIWYVTIPAVAPVFIRVWFITSPESAEKPATLPSVRLAVQ